MTVDSRCAPQLKLIPTLPAVRAEGTLRGMRAIDGVDWLATDVAARTPARGGWGSGSDAHNTNFTLPEREVPRLVPVASPHAAITPDHPLPQILMRSTRRLDLLVPIADNEGRLFNPEDFASFEDQLIALAGGFTRRGTLTGVWQSPNGQVFSDQSHAYSVTVPSDVAESVMAEIARYIRTRFHQEAAWVEATPTFLAAV